MYLPPDFALAMSGKTSTLSKSCFCGRIDMTTILPYNLAGEAVWTSCNLLGVGEVK